MFHRIAFLFLGLALAFNAAAEDTTHERTVRIGGDIVISEAIPGPLVAVGGNVSVGAPVSGRAQLVGGKITIASNASVAGDVGVAGGDITIDGSVGGRVKAAGGKVRINGPVAGDASVAAGTLELGPDARIEGKVHFKGGELRRDPAAQVTGGVDQTAGGFATDHPRTPMERFLHGWIWTVGLMVLAAIIAAALPGPSNRMAKELHDRPWVTLALGFVALFAIPVVAVLLVFTVIGIPIAFLALLGYVALLLVGYVWLAVVLGGMLLDRVKPHTTALAAWRAGAAVLAMLVIALLVRVPYVGGLAHLVAFAVGIGMIVAVVFAKPQPPQALPA
jgi:cytoskeletal protein CcmA (bactofilin family)